ncbi:MAG: hypothetical protein CFE23_01410 [Flavobacterium sp. BFFFF1]|nr:MAG: hypothetical protein CFE23_01410 [Flavobacterium sp. BFFFF1]
MRLTSKLFFTFLLAISFSVYSQTGGNYMGALKLNDSSFISYRVHLDESKGIISGYSITDIGGKYETKSKITGTFNKEKGEISFKEKGIIYTKSKVTQYDFCFVNFKGKLSNIQTGKAVKGKFKGLYTDGKECISGELNLVNVAKIERQAVKLEKKVKKTKLVSQAKKDKVNLVKSLDTLALNVLREDQNMSMFTKSRTVNLNIYDSGKEDGDKITITVNKKVLLSDYTVTKKVKILSLNIDSDETDIEIKAISEGTVVPNTAYIEIKDEENDLKVLSTLTKGKSTKITILRAEK